MEPRNIPGMRVGRSVRYGMIEEISFDLDYEPAPAPPPPSPQPVDGWREVFASNGHPVIGDRPHCDGPTVCMWVSGVSVSGGRFNTPKSQRLLLRHPDGALEAPPPERFSRLFEREEAVCLCADRGELTSEYGKRLLKEREMEEKLAAEEEEEAAEDGEEEDEDPPEVT